MIHVDVTLKNTTHLKALLHTKHTPSSQGHSFMSAVSFSRTIHPAMMKKLQYKQPKAMTPPFNHSLLCIHGVSLLLWLIEAYFNYLYSGKCWLLVLLPINHLANKDFYLFNYSTLGFTVRTASDVSEVFRISLLLWCLVLQRDSHRTSALKPKYPIFSAAALNSASPSSVWFDSWPV